MDIYPYLLAAYLLSIGLGFLVLNTNILNLWKGSYNMWRYAQIQYLTLTFYYSNSFKDCDMPCKNYKYKKKIGNKMLHNSQYYERVTPFVQLFLYITFYEDFLFQNHLNIFFSSYSRWTVEMRWQASVLINPIALMQ